MTSASDDAPQPPAASVAEPAALPTAPPRGHLRRLTIPERSFSLLLTFVAVGAVVLVFAYQTVHRREPESLAASSVAACSQFEITYWLAHGYFRPGGLRVRTPPTSPFYFYRSSTGGPLV